MLIITIREKLNDTQIIMAENYSNGTWTFKIERFRTGKLSGKLPAPKKCYGSLM